MCCVKLEGEGFMGIRAPHKVDPSVASIPLKSPCTQTPPPQGLYTIVWEVPTRAISEPTELPLGKKLKEAECTPMVHSLT
jgi:hypothetical protein